MFSRQTLKGKNLRLDLAAAVVTAIIVLLSAWYVFADLKERFLQINVADASNASIFIESELLNAQDKLVLYGMLSEQDRHRIAQVRYDSYSDLYAIDHEGRIKTIYKSSPNSQAFTGYKFSAGPVWQQLLQDERPTAISSIVQGFEDGLPSVYLIHRNQDVTILGRLNLDYIRDFMQQYSQLTGNILLITTNNGVVMISGQPQISLPRIDIPTLNAEPQQLARIEDLGQGWIPVVNESPALGARLVVLVSTSLLDNQRNAFLLAMAAVLVGLILVIWLKSKKLNHDVLLPIATLMRRIRAMETGQRLTEQTERTNRPPAEFAEIDLRFESMAQAIKQRELALESAAREIAQRENELRLILEHVPVPLIVFETASPSNLTFINRSFTEVFGYTSEQIKTISQLFQHSCQTTETASQVANQVSTMVNSHARNGAPNQPIEVPIACKSGVLHDVVIAAISLEESAIATFVDVTALRKSQRELLAAKLHAEEQEQQKTHFLAMMSHEIRTPLTSILGITELLNSEDLSARQRDLTTRLIDVGNLLMRIINDVLDHSKIEAGELSIEPREFSLNELMLKCERMFTKTASDKALALSIELDPSCPQWVSGDAVRIEQVLANLVGNAIKFTDFGEITVKVNCIETVNSLHRIRFEVIDTGLGIPKEQQQRIFSPFKQVERPSGARAGGTGLGLSISKRVIELMGGAVGFSSQPNQGSTFWFELTLPAADPTHTATQITHKPTKSSKGASLNGMRVLVVDDSQAIQFLIQEMLEPHGAKTTSALDGIQAIERLQQKDQFYDAVLMDIQMPNMDGIECTKAIRADDALKHIPVIAMTAGLLDSQRKDILSVGANALLPKPIQADTLVSSLLCHWRNSSAPEFPKIAGIDLSHAAKTMNHDPDLFKRLLRLFIQEHQMIASQTLEDLKNNQRAQAARRMHSLRGGSSQIGALEISDLASSIEQWVLERDSTPTKLIHELEQKIHQLGSSIEQAVGGKTH